MSNVLVIFQANTERTEQLALAVGVGAVESEADIRLRRLVGAGAVEVGHKGYGTLKEADLVWANTIVVGLEDAQPKQELEGLLSALTAADKSSSPQKRVWTFGTGGRGWEDRSAVLRRSGLPGSWSGSSARPGARFRGCYGANERDWTAARPRISL